MRQTVVGVFDRYAAARQAAQQLRDSGFEDSVYVTDELEGERFDGTRGETPAREEGVMAHVRHFFSDLFGSSDEQEVGPYAEAVRRGGALVKVEVEADDQAEAARAALEAAGAIDIEERASEWRASGWQEGSSLLPPESIGGTAPLTTAATTGAAGPTPGSTLPSSADLQAASASRRERTGGVRVYPRADKTPAHESPLGDGGADRTTGIAAGNTPGDGLGDEVGSGAWRSHFDSTYASSGGLWEDYEPAYRWGDAMRSDSRYRGRAWNDVEPELQRDWEGRQPGTWERFKAGVRQAWERMTD
jgi:hypothetical protein